MQPHRIQPQLPVEAVKTYQVASPIRSHYRRASCKEVRCPNYEHGWRTVLPASSHDLIATLRRSGRKITSETVRPDGMVEFIFEAGQPCFESSKHVTSLEREPLYIVKGGDWRGNPRGERMRHANADDFVDDFANHQQKLADRMEQG